MRIRNYLNIKFVFVTLVAIFLVIILFLIEKSTVDEQTLRDVRDFYESTPSCSYSLSKEEIQKRIDDITSYDAALSYRSVAELILLSDNSIPILIDNLNRTDSSNALIILPRGSFEEYGVIGKNTVGKTINVILNAITGVYLGSVNETNQDQILNAWKGWYNQNKDFLVCDPDTGKTIVLNQTREVSEQ